LVVRYMSRAGTLIAGAWRNAHVNGKAVMAQEGGKSLGRICPRRIVSLHGGKPNMDVSGWDVSNNDCCGARPKTNCELG
jgi:hypothetical protein